MINQSLLSSIKIIVYHCKKYGVALLYYYYYYGHVDPHPEDWDLYPHEPDIYFRSTQYILCTCSALVFTFSYFSSSYVLRTDVLNMLGDVVNRITVFYVRM